MLAESLLVLWAALAAVYDWRFQRLPNWLTLGALGVGAAYLLVAGAAPLAGEPRHNWLAAGVALVALLPAYLGRWMGAGDVKFFTAMGLLGGGKVLLPTFLCASLLAGAWALVLLAAASPSLLPFRQASGLNAPPRKLPFGVPLAAGFILSVLDVFPVWLRGWS